MKASASVEGETSLLTDYRDDEFSHSFTTTWSYTTSAESLDAGRESDMFLVPGKLRNCVAFEWNLFALGWCISDFSTCIKVINIQFVETVTISWNQTDCTAGRSQKVS